MQDVNLILGKRVAGVGLFFSLTDNAAVGEKKKAVRLQKVCCFVKWANLQKLSKNK